MSKTTDKAAELYGSARANDYVNRLMEDKELRESVIDAFKSSKKAYSRINGSRKGPVNAVTNDRKVQKDLRKAADSLREASEQFKAPKKKRKGKVGKVLLVVLAAAGITFAVSEDARRALLDALFGPEEEFEYTSPASENGGETS